MAHPMHRSMVTQAISILPSLHGRRPIFNLRRKDAWHSLASCGNRAGACNTATRDRMEEIEHSDWLIMYVE